jgi:hypothetical protein
MPRSLTPEQTDEVVKLLQQTEEPDVADRLTDWEKEFIQSVAEQFSNINWLSPDKQIPKLKQIVEGERGETRRENRRSVSRSQRVSYRGSGEALGSPRGGFSGFGGSGEED